MHDKFKKRVRVGHADDRLRRQIATEAARRLMPKISPDPSNPRLIDISSLEYEAAKRQAVAVLGQRVRLADLPTDAEVRTQVLQLRNSAVTAIPDPDAEDTETAVNSETETEEDQPVLSKLADHIDRFEVFRLRLEPLQEIKLDPRWHPEVDALFHSLQVFELAYRVRPYDEEFLLAALLHEIGRAIDPADPVPAALRTLEGTIEERCHWLIANLQEILPKSQKPAASRVRYELRASPYFEDLELLGELDLAGREPGVDVRSLEEALRYLRTLETENAFEGDV